MQTKFITFFALCTLILGSACARKSSVSNQEQQVTESQSSEQMADNKEERTIVLLETDLGNIKIELYNETPLHRDNFVKLVKDGFYDGTLFHRVIKDFMIQGGDPDSKGAKPGQMLGMGGPEYTVPAEFNAKLIHKKGALAAARQGDQQNPKKASSGSQFYIAQGKVYSHGELENLSQRMGKQMSTLQMQAYTTVGGVPFLDGDYTVFGQVIEGLDVIDKIAATPTAPGDRPLKDIKITLKIVSAK